MRASAARSAYHLAEEPFAMHVLSLTTRLYQWISRIAPVMAPWKGVIRCGDSFECMNTGASADRLQSSVFAEIRFTSIHIGGVVVTGSSV